MWRKTIVYGSISGFLAVVLGAFGAHGLTKIVAEKELLIWNKAVLYQLIHTFAILYIGLAIKLDMNKLLNTAFRLFTFGILLFSGSLYLLTFHEVIDFGVWKNFLGPVTPIGGLLFLAGWICLLVYGLKLNKNEK
jgi:uncharacterized membrane protein YgdD (TMEM256/DUF423 family)